MASQGVLRAEMHKRGCLSVPLEGICCPPRCTLLSTSSKYFNPALGPTLPLHPAAKPMLSHPSQDVFPSKLCRQLALPTSLQQPGMVQVSREIILKQLKGKELPGCLSADLLLAGGDQQLP